MPKRHWILVTLLAVVLAGVWIGAQAVGPQANAANVYAPVPETPAPVAEPALVPAKPPTPKLVPLRTRVRKGDTASTIFQRHGLADRDLQLVLASRPLGQRLETIHPGNEFEFERDAQGKLLRMSYRLGPLNTVEFERVGDAFEGHEVAQEPDRRTEYAHSVIQQSLYVACQRVGLGDKFAQKLADIFEWDIDFILDIRPGDEFHVLYHEEHLDGKSIGLGDILVAEFVNQGDVYTAIRYEDESRRTHYYTPEGENMRKAFLRAPVKYTRISSHFNKKRVHPLWKSSMPHNGIDYAAPTGTAVRAAGDGKVVTKSHTPANGNYIVIRHGQRYQTKYLHLSRFARGLREGQTVQQDQTIGYVGATGWATGAHLHYEFLVDGVHRNPRTVALPRIQRIGKSEQRGFELHKARLLDELKRYKEEPQEPPAVALETVP